MKTFTLYGIDKTGGAVKLGKDVISFVDKNGTFSVTVTNSSYIQLSTKKGVYNLPKHPTLNYFNAIIPDAVDPTKGYPVQVYISKTTGWLKFGKQR